MSTAAPRPLAAEVEILIVGAGPVGATLALELARHGVASVVVDRAPAASRHPKMDFLNARSMELLARLGLDDELRALGVPPDQPFTFRWFDDFGDAPLDEWHHPSVAEHRAIMGVTNDGTQPRHPYLRVMGSRLEELLRRRCRDEALIDLREGWAFESTVDLDMDGVTVRLVDTATGQARQVRVRHLVAADGAGSAVRRATGIPVDELGPRMLHCDVFFRSADPRLGARGPFFLGIFGRGLTLVARDGGELWTGTFPLPDGQPFTGDPVAEIQARMGVDLVVDEVLTTAHWEGRLGLASSYRRGPVFLAGDAAHHFFPTGGHGANTGIGDAVDLGWKLAAVVNGWARAALLDSYDAERRPVARFNREMCFNLLEVWRRFPELTAGGVGRAQRHELLAHERHQISNAGIHLGYRYGDSPVVVPDGSPEPAWTWAAYVPTTWPGARVPSVRTAEGRELFDELGPGFTLVDLSGSHAGKPLVEEAERLGVPLARRVVDDAHVRAVWERPLVLVRPDHHVAWRGDEAPADPAAVLRRICGR